MIKKWIINGDLHGEFERLRYLRHETPNETAIVCLGDFGGYYYLNNKETDISSAVAIGGSTHRRIELTATNGSTPTTDTVTFNSNGGSAVASQNMTSGN